MGHKNDLIVWLQLHPAQRHIYEVRVALAEAALLSKHRVLLWLVILVVGSTS